jgi:hypothetical protein
LSGKLCERGASSCGPHMRRVDALAVADATYARKDRIHYRSRSSRGKIRMWEGTPFAQDKIASLVPHPATYQGLQPRPI